MREVEFLKCPISQECKIISDKRGKRYLSSNNGLSLSPNAILDFKFYSILSAIIYK